MSVLEKIIIEKLSFYRPIDKGEIILNINDVELKEVGNLDLQALDHALKMLKRKGLIKSIKKNNHTLWQRINPGKISWFKKIYYRLDLDFLTTLFKK